MKKNIRINISGLIFNIDEDAYSVLQNYINRLKQHFGKGESTDEIISDIESRIAELFQEKTPNSENVINLDIVNQAIKAMGEPGEIDGDEEAFEQNENPYNKNYKSSYEKVKRKLYRDEDDKVIGGVASGLAAYFGIATIWIRLIFVILTLSGMSILVYIILWIVIPKARTTSQKLEMRGEAINLENIERSIRDEFDDISDRFRDMKDKHFSKKKDELTIFEKIAHVIVSIISGIIKIIGSFLAIILAIIALIFIIAFIPGFFGNSVFWLYNINGFHFVSLNNLLNLLSNSQSDINILHTSLTLIVFIPLISLVYLGVKTIFGIRTKNNAIGISLLTIWIVGLIMFGFSSLHISKAYNRKAEITHKAELGVIDKDTIFINFVNNDTAIRELPLINPINGAFVFCNDDNYFYMNPNVTTTSIDSNEEVTIQIQTISRGKNYIHAQHNVEEINYKYSYSNNKINLDDYCYWPREIGYRNQKVKIEIGIPEGKIVVFSPKENRNYRNNELEKYFDSSKVKRFIYINEDKDRIIISNGENKIDIN